MKKLFTALQDIVVVTLNRGITSKQCGVKEEYKKKDV